METQCISNVELDDTTILWRNADVEQERKAALADLIEENSFKPLRALENGHQGPWHLRLSIQDGRLAMAIRDAQDNPADTIMLGLARFRRPVREYFAICDSYYKAVRRASAQEIETVDMARRATHDQATRLLLEALEDKVETDFATARRLFTLICVLHIKA
ncbi:UPF0262 family protein [Altericroceibacterium spongiae]|uniref:UPF0262 family protein n=1 Tax=Altericroceibacterium spongiae TaxID=2320269 RepID=A0A420EMZ8_9SPHN|nr:UPF0262 family protein [Altericroceibacterium spongiae]RKF22023.1 UPF0262 family protein [Altericroceibacterium spongiae]